MIIRHNSETNFLKSISDKNAVFHYTRKSTALENILFDDCFRFSSLVNANDPYEYNDKLIGAIGWDWDNSVEEKIHETCKIVGKLIAENVSYISCCRNRIEKDSLTNYGFLKSRMWSQYGENHEGICLIFSREKLVRIIREQFSNEEFTIYEGDVNYKDYVNDTIGPRSVKVNSDTFDTETPINVAFKHLQKYQKELLFCKQLDYKDEDEYRVVALRKPEGENLQPAPEFSISKCLIGVVLGDRFPKVYMPSIDKLSINMNFEHRKLHWESGEYLLLGNNKG